MKRELEGKFEVSLNKKFKHSSSDEAIIETSSETIEDQALNSSYSSETEEDVKTVSVNSSGSPISDFLKDTKNSDTVNKNSTLDPQLEEIVTNSLNEIDEIANKDLIAPEHLRNVLKTIKGVFDSPSAYKSKLKELYEQDPYMLDAKDAIASIVLIVNGVLPDVEKSFKMTKKEYLNFTDYILEVQEVVANKLADRYSDFITCNEDFELTLLGE